jgi:hypothetical protein
MSRIKIKIKNLEKGVRRWEIGRQGTKGLRDSDHE